MKRLKNILLSMEEKTTTFAKMYEGPMLVHSPSPNVEPWSEYDSRYYWREEISFDISHTHKLAQDRPTVLISIPLCLLGLTDGDVNEGSTMAADFCLRRFLPCLEELNAELYNRSRPDTENGKYIFPMPGGEVLVRNCAYFACCPQKDYVNGSGLNVYLQEGEVARAPRLCLCFRIQVQLPLRKLRKSIQMLCRDLPAAIDRFVGDFDRTAFDEALSLARRQRSIRALLKTHGLCAFVANGSILPRAKGGGGPMVGAIPFVSTPEDEIELCGVRGMGICCGVTVITGGGYSGKSTLLDAISAGIYDHAPGDGRELCLTDESAMTVSAEDGRCVKAVNISPFIRYLPSGDPHHFSTDHASGSTSQAANIMEAVEVGAGLLLIDEDRSATNFMIRDGMMKQLIEKEPITPFTDRVGELYERCGVSTILVIGGSGEYLSVADRVYLMEDYRIHDATSRAREICGGRRTTTFQAEIADFAQRRHLCAAGFRSYPAGRGTERLEVSELGYLLMGDEQVDLRGLHDLITPGQQVAMAFVLRQLAVRSREAVIDLGARLSELYAEIEQGGLDILYSNFFTTMDRFMDLPRIIELRAAVARMRHVNYRAEGKQS